MTRDSIIFDLDGTLWDASETVVRAFNDSIQEVGFDIILTSLDIRNFSGMKMDDIFAQHFSFIPKEKIHDFENIYSEKEKRYLNDSGGRLFPKVRETLEKLKQNHRLFIVSNCLSGYIESFLDFYDLNTYFEDWECFGNDGLSKDENIRLILRRNDLQNPVYVGDTIWDKESSEKAGVDFIYAEYGFGTIENSNPKIQNFEDLLSLEF
jgi:phosphoglycolate phosphatase